MANRREIPTDQKPNAAPRSDVDRVVARIKALGIEYHSAVKQARLSRQTGYRLLGYTASVGTLRKLEEWVVAEEHRQNKAAAFTKDQGEQLLEGWQQLGEELLSLDPAGFAIAADSLRDVIESIRIGKRAADKMLLATNPRGI